MNKNNKTVFITGASKGLGKVIFNTFVEKGFKVFATARNIPIEESQKMYIGNL